jgi:hypothetical protein
MRGSRNIVAAGKSADALHLDQLAWPQGGQPDRRAAGSDQLAALLVKGRSRERRRLLA